MADTAAHRVDRVLPQAPVRQWVLSLPHSRSSRLAFDVELCGAVTFVQRFGDALNLNVHFHSLILDGVYLRPLDGSAQFRALPPPTDAEVERVAASIRHRAATGPRAGRRVARVGDRVTADDLEQPRSKRSRFRAR